MLRLQHNYGIIFIEKMQVVGEKMKKRIIAGLLLTNFIAMNTTPALAFIHLGVQKDNIDTQPKTEKVKAEKIKIKKDKKVRWTKLKISNKYDFINLPWWEDLGDECLNEYIQKAVEHNHSAKIASLTVDEYYQNVKSQMANELPTINGGFIPGIGGNNHNSNGSMIFPVFVNYELDLFLKNHDKTKSVKKLYEASIQDERATYISIVSAVGTTYYNVVMLDKLIETQKRIVSLRQEIYNAMALSNKEGITSTSDVVKANKALVSGQADLIDLEKTRIKALNQLAVLIGESPANSLTLKRANYNDVIYKYNAPNEISSEIVTQRPDYIKAEIMLEKSGIDVRVAKKEFLPSLNIGGMALFNAKSAAGLMPDFLWGVGGGVIETFFAGGAKIANLKLNKVKYEKMLESYKDTNLTSIQEINDAMYAYKYSNDKYKQNLINQKLETKDFNLSKKMYEQGVISKLDLNQKHENLLSIDNLVVQNKINCIIDSIGYYKATGAGVNNTQRLK